MSRSRLVVAPLFSLTLFIALALPAPQAVHAQTCPGLGKELFAVRVRSGLTGLGRVRGVVNWEDESTSNQQIKVNGGNSRVAMALMTGEGTGFTPPTGTGNYRLTAGFMLTPGETLVKSWFFACEGLPCGSPMNASGTRTASFKPTSWAWNTDYLVTIRKISTSGSGTGASSVWMAQTSAPGTTPILWTVSGSTDVTRVAGAGIEQRATTHNSIGFTRLKNVAAGTANGNPIYGITTGTTTENAGFWLRQCSGSTNVGTNTGCSSSGIGNGLTAGCF